MYDLPSRLAHFVRGIWRELPLECIGTFAAALALVGLSHNNALSSAQETWAMRVFCGAVLWVPLCFALTVLRERGVLPRAVHVGVGALAGVAVLAALWAALGSTSDADSLRFGWPYGLSLLVAFPLPFVAVAVGEPATRLRRFLTFVRRFFAQTTIWVLVGAVAHAALGVIFGALNELFQLDIFRIWADTAAFVSALIVLAYLYRMSSAADPSGQGAGDEEPMPELWRRLATAVGVPFVCVMLAILVVYELMVLGRGELPRNLLSPLVIGAGFAGFLCVLIIAAMLDQHVGKGPLSPADPHRWARRRSIRVVRAFPLVLLALLPMAGWALMLRIEQYGFTPFRVVRMAALVCLGVLSALGTWRWLRARTPLTWQMPAAIAGFALVTAFGPLSAINLSLSSQVERLDVLLDQAGIAGRHVAAPDPGVLIRLDGEAYWELERDIELLVKLGGEDGLAQVLTGDLEPCLVPWSGGQACLRRLGVEREDYDGRDSYDASFSVSGSFPAAAGPLRFFGDGGGEFGSDSEQIWLEGDSVVLKRGDERLASGSLAQLISLDPAPPHDFKLPARWLVLSDDAGRELARVAVSTLSVTHYPPNQPTFYGVRGVWLRTAP
ncbi:DUF4153 domain-containing protein [Haliangium ochraceum]|uniref:DUF4153 domain-containing protein n=1 Tax=Haliangium ochraceum (strain DSM 14365 / JCM 11303 / SMP-2) TaxID=502025 RepID=D0LL90_HALO1|nr:DUF4153 domain-containing protein [Haliangium ochraceum]ACY18586.1 hypothetical protein Hoch_6111 [Haliangium ochraceum DSM 14365]